MIQAAVEGQGVALGRSALTAIDLEAGRLVQPFGPSIPSQYRYFIVLPAAHAERPKVQAFREWLLEDTTKDKARDAAMTAP